MRVYVATVDQQSIWMAISLDIDFCAQSHSILLKSRVFEEIDRSKKWSKLNLQCSNNVIRDCLNAFKVIALFTIMNNCFYWFTTIKITELIWELVAYNSLFVRCNLTAGIATISIFARRKAKQKSKISISFKLCLSKCHLLINIHLFMALTQVCHKPNTNFPSPQINNHSLSDAHYTALVFACQQLWVNCLLTAIMRPCPRDQGRTGSVEILATE